MHTRSGLRRIHARRADEPEPVEAQPRRVGRTPTPVAVVGRCGAVSVGLFWRRHRPLLTGHGSTSTPPASINPLPGRHTLVIARLTDLVPVHTREARLMLQLLSRCEGMLLNRRVVERIADTRPTEVATTGEARSSPKRRCNARRWLNCWAGWANPTTTKTTRPENLRRSGLAPTEAPVMAAAGLDAASWYRTALSERADL
jgi:hypothetical protein